ncbi:hypothetical protein [Pseudogemmobacter faecipullorum]|uniref:Uncharacterized protein n=1 Tax=Pseudogemmobacter faecipullorum TaxID=2755041 RepID=A0ABS8CPL9_9RHOB|nr:hypothetical protein [Pseudogemmobacter faecipullorum]MCB5411331.1 hypothetical protein [Pseudogemmobacter faecipullorum]
MSLISQQRRTLPFVIFFISIGTLIYAALALGALPGINLEEAHIGRAIGVAALSAAFCGLSVFLVGRFLNLVRQKNSAGDADTLPEYKVTLNIDKVKLTDAGRDGMPSNISLTFELSNESVETAVSMDMALIVRDARENNLIAYSNKSDAALCPGEKLDSAFSLLLPADCPSEISVYLHITYSDSRASGCSLMPLIFTSVSKNGGPLIFRRVPERETFRALYHCWIPDNTISAREM